MQTEKVNNNTFFHIGWMRTASTFLQDLFRTQESVEISLKNRFFSYDQYYSKGSDYYYNNVLPPLRKNALIIDSDENYSMGRFKRELINRNDNDFNYKAELQVVYHDIDEMVKRLKSTVHDAKILGIIRNQVDWFESVYIHDVYHYGLDKKFSEFLDSELGIAYQKAADYNNVFETFEKHFGKENVKLLLFEDLKYQRVNFFNSISEFIGCKLDLSRTKNLRKNINIKPGWVNTYRRINKLSQKKLHRKEKTVYNIIRKVFNILVNKFPDLQWSNKDNILSPHNKELIKNKYLEDNLKLAHKMDRHNDMKNYGYF